MGGGRLTGFERKNDVPLVVIRAFLCQGPPSAISGTGNRSLQLLRTLCSINANHLYLLIDGDSALLLQVDIHFGLLFSRITRRHTHYTLVISEWLCVVNVWIYRARIYLRRRWYAQIDHVMFSSCNLVQAKSLLSSPPLESAIDLGFRGIANWLEGLPPLLRSSSQFTSFFSRQFICVLACVSYMQRHRRTARKVDNIRDCGGHRLNLSSSLFYHLGSISTWVFRRYWQSHL